MLLPDLTIPGLLAKADELPPPPFANDPPGLLVNAPPLFCVTAVALGSLFTILLRFLRFACLS